MRPHFRSDLQCSREEQQGVVFYRVDDPRSETNFRLYEIEYLIATKLDGERTLDDVIALVRDEHSFDISEPDLERFVSQLESMGFLENGAGWGLAADDPEADAETLEMKPDPIGDVDLLPELDAVEVDATDIEPGEYERLLRSALLHVRQGLLVHARDYFLAARELDSSNEKLAMVVSHLEIVGDSPSTAEMDYMWEQASALAPEIAAEVIDMTEGTEVANRVPDTFGIESEEDIRSRVLWTLALLVVLVAGTGAIYWASQEFDVFAAPQEVRVAELKSTRMPDYFPSAATAVRAFREKRFGFSESGRVESLLVKAGDRVTRDQTLAMLELPPRLDRKLQAVRRKVDKAQAVYDKAARKVEAIEANQQSIQLERDDAVERLKELQPKQLLGRGSVSKREIEKWKRATAQANKKLSQLAKKKRKPEAQARKAKKKLDAATKRLTDQQRRLGGKILKAPITGKLVELKITEGRNVSARASLATLRDERSVVLSFQLDDAPKLQAGGQAFVSVKGGKPTNAKVSSRKGDTGEVFLEIALDDPTGAYLETDPGEFKLVRDYVEPAFEVPTSALSKREGSSVVFVVRQNRAHAVPISILRQDAAQAVITNSTGSLRNGDRLVTADVESGSVSELRDGSLLKPSP
ncbi:MAG: HlyD family efflux transporter periplasmic adaptor subunit [Myxococcota bacterium]